MGNCMLAQGYNGFDVLFSSPCALRTLKVEYPGFQYIRAYRPKRAMR